jgi:hypothetical protein
MPKSLKYVERCTGSNHNGPAWIGFVEESRTGRMTYFNGRAFQKYAPRDIGCHFDVETGERYWISGIKRRGSNRHWAGSGRIEIEEPAVQAFLDLTGAQELDRTLYLVVPAFPATDRQRIREIMNARGYGEDDAA